jgi:hypothetical protein
VTKELLKLPQTQLAYARAARLIEMNIEEAMRPLDREDEEHVKGALRNVVNKLENLGNLKGQDVWNWRYRTPLDDLYEFTASENDLLLDLYDAGGKQSTRRPDSRFDRLGGGSGIAKGAVSLSAQHDKWHVNLTDRGREYIERVLLSERGS